MGNEPCKQRCSGSDNVDLSLVYEDEELCTTRKPVVGDAVCHLHGERVVATNWMLEAGAEAIVKEVDPDGDFRLQNPSGEVSKTFLLRKNYKYVQAVDVSGLFVEGSLFKPSQVAESPVETFKVVLSRTGVYAKSIGLVISPDDNPKHLVVDRLLERSLISEWNEKQRDERRMVRPGAVILTVNGVQGDGERMLNELQSSQMGSTITLTVEVPVNLESVSTTSGGSQQDEELKVSEDGNLDSSNMMYPDEIEVTPTYLKEDRSRAQFEVTLERTGPHAKSIGLIVSPDDHPRHLVVDEVCDVGLTAAWNWLQESDCTKVRPGDLLLSVNGVRGNSKLMLKELSRKTGSTIKFTVDGTTQTDIDVNVDMPIQVDNTKQNNSKKKLPAAPPSHVRSAGWV